MLWSYSCLSHFAVGAHTRKLVPAQARDMFQWAPLSYTPLCCFQGLLQIQVAKRAGISFKGSYYTARLSKWHWSLFRPSCHRDKVQEEGCPGCPPDRDGCLWCLEREHSSKLHLTIEDLCSSTRTREAAAPMQQSFANQVLEAAGGPGSQRSLRTVTSNSHLRVAWAFHPISLYWGHPSTAACRYKTGTGTRQHDGEKPWPYPFFSAAPDLPHVQKQGLHPRRPQINFPGFRQDWKDCSSTCHTCRAPGTLPGQWCTFEKDEEGKKSELKKELDGTGLPPSTSWAMILENVHLNNPWEQSMAPGYAATSLTLPWPSVLFSMAQSPQLQSPHATVFLFYTKYRSPFPATHGKHCLLKLQELCLKGTGNCYKWEQQEQAEEEEPELSRLLGQSYGKSIGQGKFSSRGYLFFTSLLWKPSRSNHPRLNLAVTPQHWEAPGKTGLMLEQEQAMRFTSQSQLQALAWQGTWTPKFLVCFWHCLISGSFPLFSVLFDFCQCAKAEGSSCARTQGGAVQLSCHPQGNSGWHYLR